jgi:hypothetical protein
MQGAGENAGESAEVNAANISGQKALGAGGNKKARAKARAQAKKRAKRMQKMQEGERVQGGGAGTAGGQRGMSNDGGGIGGGSENTPAQNTNGGWLFGANHGAAIKELALKWTGTSTVSNLDAANRSFLAGCTAGDGTVVSPLPLRAQSSAMEGRRPSPNRDGGVMSPEDAKRVVKNIPSVRERAGSLKGGSAPPISSK